MDSGVGAVRFPTVQIGLGFRQTLEAFSFERGSLRVPDAGFNFSFAVGIVDPARQGHSSVMGEHVAIKRVQSGVVEIGDQDTFFEVVQDHDPRTATESTEGFLVELGPDAGTGAEGQEAY